MEARKAREQAFHDAYFGASRSRGHNFYAVADAGLHRYEQPLMEGAAGRRVLEYGCGKGSYAYLLARLGAEVTGIDISPVAIEQARLRAREEHLDTLDFRVMDAEALEFPDDTFDVICGTGILHHLDLERSLSEIARCLKPDGVGIFLEPLGHNPLINLYRRLTPHTRTVDEHPFLMRDFRLAEQHFGRVELDFRYLISLAATPFHRSKRFGRIAAALDAVDDTLFRCLPFTRKYAWQVVIQLREARKAQAEPARRRAA